MASQSRPKCYILIGIPGSGKTTWVESQSWSADTVITSTDKYIEQIADAMSLTYSEVFEDHMPEAVFSMLSDIKRARSERNNIVWDQTSVSRVSRARKINMLPEYDIIGILFPTPSPKELRARLDSRPGKQIPESVIEQMLRSFELPTLDEGFTNIIDFTHRMENIDGLC